MNILGIESSCDETAAAIVQENGTVISNVISSQTKLHNPFGGIVPEIASRAHMAHIQNVISEALNPLPKGLDDVDAIAVTQGPGLIGALWVGLQTAKAIAWSKNIPIVGVNHLEGHLFSVFLQQPNKTIPTPQFPFVGLLVSGGHTTLYRVSSFSDYEVIGQTRDDAVGEAFDKVAKLLDLGYPGGPVIDKLATPEDSTAKNPTNPWAFPPPMLHSNSLDFSFSGIKTSIAVHLKKNGLPKNEAELKKLCADFQDSVTEVLVKKSIDACQQYGISELVVTGGVAANQGLRKKTNQRCADLGITSYFPPLSSCTDNAAMIAYTGAQKILLGEENDIHNMAAYSRASHRKRGKFNKAGKHVPRTK